MSTRDVAKRIGVSQSSVAKYKLEIKEPIPEIPSGRPRKITGRDERMVVGQIERGEVETATEMASVLQRDLGIEVDRRTVSNLLHEHGLQAFHKVKRPYLKPKHKEDRLKFALEHQNWTFDDWKKILFSDESKSRMYDSDGLIYRWGRRGKPLTDKDVTETVKFGGGSVLFWGCFSENGTGNLCRIVGIMNAKYYQEILEENLLTSVDKLGLSRDDFIFQQDNDRKHTAASTKSWLESHDVCVLRWPSQSPDLNPIELKRSTLEPCEFHLAID